MNALVESCYTAQCWSLQKRMNCELLPSAIWLLREIIAVKICMRVEQQESHVQQVQRPMFRKEGRKIYSSLAASKADRME